MKNLADQSFSTRAVHAGERAPAGEFTPVASPLHPSVGYLYENMDDLDGILGATREGYVYTRYGNPTVAAFEAAVASLEGAEAAFALSSGMAAIHLALIAAGARAGASVVAALDVYGATFALLQRLLESLDVQSFWVDISDLAAVEAALVQAHPVALIAETISNPLLKVADVPALSRLADRYETALLVDNTFASPYLFNPLAYGAAFAIHSATKYLSGHGDVTAGVIACSADRRKELYELNKLVGSVLGPFEAWLALRGVKTLPLRMERQCANAARIAAWLSTHARITRVHYPGLESHPQHNLAASLFGPRGFGAIVSFEIAGAGRDQVFRFMEALQLCLPATTLGDIYTLVLHPATASHRALSPAQREQVGIHDGLVRLSAGIEDPADILADLDQALTRS